MEIKFLDLQAQYRSIKSEIDNAIAGVINSCQFALGPAVEKFERNFAQYCRSKYAVGVDSGTSALVLILKGLGIGTGDEVITAANTFIATVSAIVHSSAMPVLVDIDPKTRNMDPDKIEAAINSKTKAIMPVHLYGSMAPMDEIMQIAEKHNLSVIEDAAQSQGAKYKDRLAGSIGLAAGFSFYPGKNLGAYGEAGAITTSNEEMAMTIRKLRDHGSDRKYYHDIIGYNARMDGIQGAILDVKLKHLNDWNDQRRRVAKTYNEKLAGLPIGLPIEPDDNFDIYHQYVIEVETRDKLQNYLRERGIPTMIHYPIPIHKQKAFMAAGYKAGRLPETELLAEKILSLPVYPELDNEKADYIAEKIGEFFGKK